jgi:hypothetical protein
LLALALASCATLAPESRANAVRGPAPEVGDRCTHAADLLQQKGCGRERDKAYAYLRAKNQGDQLCLEPILGDDLTNCRARSTIDEQDPTAMQLHLIDIDPNSSWAPKAGQRIWFENTALIDLFLQEKGF